MTDLTEDSLIEALRSTLAIEQPIAFKPTHIVLEEYGPHCITVAYGNLHYRYFGMTTWRVRCVTLGDWWPVNVVRVPRDVVCEVAKHVIAKTGYITPQKGTK